MSAWVVVALASCASAPERDPDSVFEGVEGYEVAPLPPRFVREIQFEFGSKPHVAEAVTEVAVRTLRTEDGGPVATVVVVALDPRASEGEGGVREAARGFFSEPPRERTIGDREVFEGTLPGVAGAPALGWAEENLVILVLPDDPAHTEAVAEALVGS